VKVGSPQGGAACRIGTPGPNSDGFRCKGRKIPLQGAKNSGAIPLPAAQPNQVNKLNSE